MKKAADQRQALLALTIEAVGQRGLGEFSLRHLASAAGLSTTAIFQNFSGKAQLLESALELAIAQDREFHQNLRNLVAALLSTHIGFADFLARYVLMRAALPQARFASEILIALDDYPGCHDLALRWHAERTAFWTALLDQLDARPGLARVVADYSLMEEFYAYSLRGESTYPLLLAETCRALSDCAFHDGAAGPVHSHVSLKLDTQPLSIRESDDSSDAPIKEQLLEQALRIIEESGLEALNQRRLARSAGVSSSAVAYYFKDMKSFRNRAIWRALVSGIPSQLNPERFPVEQPRDLRQWLETLEDLLVLGEAGRPAGFYIGFTRLTGQACLLSRHDPSLLPLIAYLRELEGWGTYRVSRNIPALASLIGRDHAAAFGMWIKAEALLRRAGLTVPTAGMERLEFAAGQIFPEPER
jgi:AcrR family transcriptional regulator